MKIARIGLLMSLVALALAAYGLNARAETIPITGGAGWLATLLPC